MKTEIIILAAGKGTRMRSTLPKVLHPIGGQSMLQRLIKTAAQISPDVIHVVIGHGKDQVIDTIANSSLPESDKRMINWVEQTEQLGTGHAVVQAMEFVNNESMMLVLNGDTPLIRTDTLTPLLNSSKENNSLSLLTVCLDDATGMGRILRDESGHIFGVVEHKDADPDQRKIREINTNCMAGPAGKIRAWLSNLDSNNAQGEYYLPDIISAAAKSSHPVMGYSPQNPIEVAGVNSKADLSQLERAFQAGQAEQLLNEGVTLMDPSRIDIRGNCHFGTDCTVDVNVILEGDITIGDHCHIGANSIIRDSVIGDHTVIEPNSLLEQTQTGEHCTIGPFARLRPGTRLADGVKIGNFVETKNSHIAESSKVNHLSYVGDSEVGQHVNIGAGVITCNYDGANKHKTVIGDHVFVGSNSQLVAPVALGSGATIGAGSTITKDVPANSLTLTRGKQKSIEGWNRPSKDCK